jgi:hypothetical protein
MTNTNANEKVFMCLPGFVWRFEQKDPAFVLDCSGKPSKPLGPKINRWIFFFSSTKPFVIAKNSSPMSSCLNCEGEGSVMTSFWEPSMNSHQFLCYDCWIRFICGGIGSNLWWIDELSSGNFLGFHCVLGDFWKRLQFWSLELEREWWNVFVVICHVMIDFSSVTGDVAFI